MRWWLSICIVSVLLVGTIIMIGVYAYRPQYGVPESIAASPATEAITDATPKPAAAEPPTTPRIQAYSDLLRTLPGMADASIGEEKLPLEQAARIYLPYWAYVCPRRDLWISHPEAPAIGMVSDEGSRGIHLTREQVVFVHWFRVGRNYRPLPVIRDEAGGFRVLRKSAGPVKLQRFDYHWPDALSLDDGFVVPTDQGVVLIRTGKDITEEYRELSDRTGAAPCLEITPTGFIAWIPSTQAAPAGQAAWYSKGAWQELAEGWSGAFLHLIPFTDGSVLQIRSESLGKVRLQIVALETAPPDPAKIKQLVRDLSDEDFEIRDASHAQLAGMGPGAWQLLESLLASEEGEARLRIQEIVGLRNRPGIGRFEILENMLRPVWRLRDGVVFLAEAGVKVQTGGTDEHVIPAWIAVRRGRPIELIPPAVARNLAVGSVDLYAAGGEWVLSDETSGAQLFFGQELFPLTKEKDFRYRKLLGIDRQNRVVLAPVDAKAYGTDLLVIDPSIADPTPLLQIWTMSVEGGDAGWTADGWPAVKRGGAYALKKEGWEGLKGELITSNPTPATRPSAAGTLTQIAGEVGGSTVWIGDSHIELHDAQGKATRQPRPDGLPADQVAGVVHNDRLYLIHTDATISRIRINPGGDRPFTLETVFAEDVPHVGNVTRVWTDPAGRVCIASGGHLTILFTDRKISPAMMDLIPASELKQARPK